MSRKHVTVYRQSHLPCSTKDLQEKNKTRENVVQIIQYVITEYVYMYQE